MGPSVLFRAAGEEWRGGLCGDPSVESVEQRRTSSVASVGDWPNEIVIYPTQIWLAGGLEHVFATH